MSEIICQTTGLCKHYKNFHVLQDVNFSINRGEIYGLVGENGAGKSTLIRILTGLAFQSSGVITLFGKTEHLQRERARIGCTIEMPALYKDMTAQQNLEIQRGQRGIPDKKCISKTIGTCRASSYGQEESQSLFPGDETASGTGDCPSG